MNKYDTLNSLVKGLYSILDSQNSDGGWAPNYKKGSSDPEATSHVILVLLRILGLNSQKLEKALLFLENQYVKPSENGIGYWPEHVTEGDPRKETMLLASFALLYAQELGRDLKIIKHNDLIKTVTETINNYIAEFKVVSWVSGRRPFWHLHMVSMLLSLKCFDNELKKKYILEIMNLCEFSPSWLTETNNSLYEGQAVLALLHNSEYNSNLVSKLIEDILIKRQTDNYGTFWNYVDKQTEGGKFEAIRWILWALEEYWERMPIKDNQIRSVIESGTDWIINNQDLKGLWKRNNTKVFGPNYCAYALLVLWKWIQIESNFPCEYLNLVIEKISDAHVSISEYEELKLQYQNKCHENGEVDLKLRKLSSDYKKTLITLRFFSITSIIFLVINFFLVSSVLNINPYTMWKFIYKYVTEIGLVSGLASLIGLFCGGVKYLKKRGKSSKKVITSGEVSPPSGDSIG